jgi:HlyD family secretion protein
VKVRIKNSIVKNLATIKAGMLARAIVPIGTKRKGLLIPKDAVVLGGPSPLVFVVDTSTPAASEGQGVQGSTNPTAKTGTVRPVPVTMGASDGRLIEIQGAIKAGDRVVVRGNERLRPGQDVVITETLDPRAEPRAKAVGR